MPPAPGIMASLVSGRPTTLDEPKTRRWVHRASSRPPPRAMEEIEEMVGICKAARSRNVARSLVRNSFVLLGYAVSFWVRVESSHPAHADSV